MEDLADYPSARQRLRLAQQAWVQAQFIQAIADGEPGEGVAWTDPLDGDDLGLVYSGTPNGTVYSEVSYA